MWSYKVAHYLLKDQASFSLCCWGQGQEHPFTCFQCHHSILCLREEPGTWKEPAECLLHPEAAHQSHRKINRTIHALWPGVQNWTVHGFCVKAHFPKLIASLIPVLKLCRNNIAEHETTNVTGNGSNLWATDPFCGHKICKKSYTPSVAESISKIEKEFTA